MRTVSMLEFRLHAERILREASRGESMVLTYRGKPVVRLEPVTDDVPDAADPFYSMGDLAADGAGTMSNDEMDRAVYGT